MCVKHCKCRPGVCCQLKSLSSKRSGSIKKGLENERNLNLIFFPSVSACVCCSQDRGYVVSIIHFKKSKIQFKLWLSWYMQAVTQKASSVDCSHVHLSSASAPDFSGNWDQLGNLKQLKLFILPFFSPFFYCSFLLFCVDWTNSFS